MHHLLEDAAIEVAVQQQMPRWDKNRPLILT